MTPERKLAWHHRFKVGDVLRVVLSEKVLKVASSSPWHNAMFTIIEMKPDKLRLRRHHDQFIGLVFKDNLRVLRR